MKNTYTCITILLIALLGVSSLLGCGSGGGGGSDSVTVTVSGPAPENLDGRSRIIFEDGTVLISGGNSGSFSFSETVDGVEVTLRGTYTYEKTTEVSGVITGDLTVAEVNGLSVTPEEIAETVGFKMPTAFNYLLTFSTSTTGDSFLQETIFTDGSTETESGSNFVIE